jgi:hypothetical protein
LTWKVAFLCVVAVFIGQQNCYVHFTLDLSEHAVAASHDMGESNKGDSDRINAGMAQSHGSPPSPEGCAFTQPCVRKNCTATPVMLSLWKATSV